MNNWYAATINESAAENATTRSFSMSSLPQPDLYLNDMTALRADVNILKMYRVARECRRTRSDPGGGLVSVPNDARKDTMINLQDLALTQNQESRLGGRKQSATKRRESRRRKALSRPTFAPAWWSR